MYKDKQIDDINYNFDEVIRVLNARRQLLISQVNELVNKLKLELRVDEEIATKKRDEEAVVLAKVRDLQNFVFAVQEKEHKRVMTKWKELGDLEREFDKVDQAWAEQQFFIYKKFRFPDDQFKINLEAMRNFARGVGHFISEEKLDKLIEPDENDLQLPKKAQTQLKRIIWFRWGTYETYKFDARHQKWSKYDTELSQDQIPPFKHLLFASITHLPDGLGAYLTGGTDELDNCYRRALFFEKYERFKIVASMIRNRAFHCSVYLKKRNEIYVIGGNQGG